MRSSAPCSRLSRRSRLLLHESTSPSLSQRETRADQQCWPLVSGGDDEIDSLIAGSYARLMGLAAAEVDYIDD